MRFSFLLFLFLVSNNLWATSPQVPPPGYYKCNAKNVELKDITPELISLSEFILEGTIISPTDLIAKNLASKKHEYAISSLVHVQSLKGNVSNEKMFIKHFTREAPYGVCIKNLLKTNKEKVIVFLVKPDEFKEQFFYFAGHSPNSLSKYQESKSKYIKNVVNEQAKSLKEFNSKFSYLKKDMLYKRVKKLIEKSLKRKYQQSSFDEITKLGKPAIPYIILLMDDYRSLPNRTTMSPNFLHYGPEVVADELSTILSFLTNKNLGSIYNGGSARERKNTINAWRVYLTSVEGKI